MKNFFYLSLSILLISCSTGNSPLMTRSQSELYCSNLHSNSSRDSICVRQLMLPKKYVEDCFNKKITPGTIEFNECGQRNLLRYPDSNISNREKDLEDEIKKLKFQQRMKEVQDNNKVVK